ncbi:DUF2786 domain-containing protein [Herminiimonas arsenitoxidans]|uniref:DUF2786 domain-containing protein n=1 Tax=Herminiimonas arsenitoxidans TaxID=1809410 RepID=UPI000970C1FF|nr:DUF2786 domain-containing protein [Herminiimonas arsenitoxidans]
MDKESALAKILKCLRLSKSANEHEAATALRQAQALMRQHRLDATDLLAFSVSEAAAKSGARAKPVAWECALANLTSDAFGCQIVFTSDFQSGYWKFIGVGANPQVAKYAFEVLLRQVKKSRSEFAKRECKRLVPASRTRRADLFCDAWVHAVEAKLSAFSGAENDAPAIAAYLTRTYPALKQLATRDRNADRNLRDKDWDAVEAGRASGRNAELNRGVGGQAEQKRIGA